MEQHHARALLDLAATYATECAPAAAAAAAVTAWYDGAERDSFVSAAESFAAVVPPHAVAVLRALAAADAYELHGVREVASVRLTWPNGGGGLACVNSFAAARGAPHLCVDITPRRLAATARWSQRARLAARGVQVLVAVLAAGTAAAVVALAWRASVRRRW